MKYLITLLIAALSLNAFSQGIPQLPYNPDENGDGLIGVPDLQGLLAQYGLEFNAAILSEDGENAVVYIGDMSYPVCASSCKNLTGFWSLATIEDLGLIFNTLPHYPTWLKPTVTFPHYSMYWSSGYISWKFSSTVINTIERCYCAAHELPKVEYSTCVHTGASTGSPQIGAVQSCIDDKLEQGWYPLGPPQGGGVSGTVQTQAFWRWAVE
jgi:hypothetical protein